VHCGEGKGKGEREGEGEGEGEHAVVRRPTHLIQVFRVSVIVIHMEQYVVARFEVRRGLAIQEGGGSSSSAGSGKAWQCRGGREGALTCTPTKEQ
jgi:hypothetical protein